MGDIGDQLILALLLPFLPLLLFPKLDGHLVDDGAQPGDLIVPLQLHGPSKALLPDLLDFLGQVLHIPDPAVDSDGKGDNKAYHGKRHCHHRWEIFGGNEVFIAQIMKIIPQPGMEQKLHHGQHHRQHHQADGKGDAGCLQEICREAFLVRGGQSSVNQENHENRSCDDNAVD
jgi:hypothetical protein